MLREIRISNLAIVPECSVRFEEGLNVLTGETGAGKSILLDAIGLLAGQRAQSQDVREGASMATVEGVFSFPKKSSVWSFLDQLGIDHSGDEMILRRTIGQDGRSRAFVNDLSTTVSTLTELSRHWLDMTGQHAQQRLLDPQVHVSILDGFLSLGETAMAYREAFGEVREIDREIQSIRAQREKTLREKEYHEFRLQELEAANLRAGEDQELASIHQRVGQKEKLIHVTETLNTLLDGEDGVLPKLAKMAQEARLAAKFDESTQPWLEWIETSSTLLCELHSESSQYSDRLDVDPEEIERINERLAALQKIARKFGSIESAIEERNRLRTFLSDAEEGALIENEWLAKREIVVQKIITLADQLTGARKKGAEKFSSVVTRELRDLGMPSSKMEVRMIPVSASADTIEAQGRCFSSKGAENIELHFSPNPGESPKPLEAIASGGELSRVLLALKGLGLKDASSEAMTFVFDEVDAGIGGETAERVGRRMGDLAKGRQVLCVTHLAQVACYADIHLQVAKSVQKGRTVSTVASLDVAQRKKELARMIGGIEITKKTQDHADELLFRAKNFQHSPLTA